MSGALPVCSPCTFLAWKETLPYHNKSHLLYLAPCYAVHFRVQQKISLIIIPILPYSLRLFRVQVTSLRRRMVLDCQL